MSEEKMKSDDQVDARDEAYERFWQDFGAKGHKVSEKMLEQLYDAGYEAALQPLDDETGFDWLVERLFTTALGGKADSLVFYENDKHMGSWWDKEALKDRLKAWNRRQGSLDGGWVEIKSEDDLPKDEGRCLWRYRSDGTPTVQYFFAHDSRQWYRDEYSHWMPIPPFVAGESDGKEEM